MNIESIIDDAANDPLADQKAIIQEIMGQLDDDQAAWHTESFLSALSHIYRTDRQEYKRFYYQLKKWGLAVDVQNEVKVFYRKSINSKKTAQTALSTLPRVTEDLKQHQNSTGNVKTAFPSIEDGALVTVSDEDGKMMLAVESDGAIALADSLRGFAAYSQTAKTWHIYQSTHWQACETEAIDKILVRLLFMACSPLGFKNCYKNATRSLIEAGDLLPMPESSHRYLPFNNGLLDCITRQLIPTTPDNAHSWCLPYAFNQKADCPTIKAWMTTAVDGDLETVELLRAWIAALLHGRADIQKYLHLYGAGGTGKGTFTRLASALIGDQNTVATTLERMERSQFETARFYGKRLVLINDSDKYGGSLETFKNLTGQDQLRLERKHQQSTGGFIYDGMVLMASNDHIVSTDHSSGTDRRRVVVVFNRRATDEEKDAWSAGGGEHAVLHSELPGLVNWALELSPSDIERIIRNPPERTKQANFEAMKANNPISEWVTECCIPELNAWSQIGDKREIRNQGEETKFEGADEKLYPSYLQWSLRHARNALSKRRFTSTLVETCRTLGIDASEVRRSQGSGVVGIKLKKPYEDSLRAWNQ